MSRYITPPAVNPPNHAELTLAGTGTFGEVYLCVDAVTREKTAIKKQCFETLLHHHKAWLTPDKIKNEVELNFKLKNTNGIVQFIQYWIEGPDAAEIIKGTHTFYKPSSSGSGFVPPDLCNHIYLQFHYCDYTLDDLIISNTQKAKKVKFEEIIQGQEVNIALVQLIHGLYGLYEAKLIHRDIHPGNIFLKIKNGRLFWMIGDLGLSREWSSDEKSANKGCKIYTSPEMAAGDKTYSYETDVFSLALVMTLFMSPYLRTDEAMRYQTFEDLRCKTQNPELKLFSMIEEDLPKDSDLMQIQWEIVKQMLVHDKHERIGIQEAFRRFDESLEDVLTTRGIKTTMSSPVLFQIPLSEKKRFIGRKTELSEIVKNLTEESNDDDCISVCNITGPKSVGKTNLAKQIISNVKHRFSCVWIDCFEAVKSWKRFAYYGTELSKNWILVFDSVEKSKGIIYLLIDVIQKMQQGTTKPKAIILTSSLPLELKEMNGIRYNLDFEWVEYQLQKPKPPSGFLEEILEEAVKSDKLFEDSRLQLLCTQLCGYVGKIETKLIKSKKYSREEVWSALLHMFVLVGFLPYVDSVNKAQFISYVSKFCDTPPELISDLIEGLPGILYDRKSKGNLDDPTATHLDVQDSEEDNEESQSDESEEEDDDSMCELFTHQLHQISFQVLLKRPIFQYIIQNPKALKDPYEVNLELSFSRKILKTYRSIKIDDCYQEVRTFHITLVRQSIADTAKFEELDELYAEEIADFLQECQDVKVILNVHERFKRRFGVIGGPTLTLSNFITRALQLQENINPNLIVQYKLEEYICFSKTFGPYHEETLFKGVMGYLQLLKQNCRNELIDKSIHFRMCQLVYLNVEVYLLSLNDGVIVETESGKVHFPTDNLIIMCLLLLAEICDNLCDDVQPTFDICQLVLALTDIPTFEEKARWIAEYAANRRDLE